MIKTTEQLIDVCNSLHTLLRDELNIRNSDDRLFTIGDELIGKSTGITNSEFVTDVSRIRAYVNSNGYRGEDIMGILDSAYVANKGKSDNGQVFTPLHITHLMRQLINITSSDHVLDAGCGSGAFLTQSSTVAPTKNLFGVEVDERVYKLARYNMKIHKSGTANIKLGDSTTDDVYNWIGSKKITKVLMNPPYEKKYNPIKILNTVFDAVGPDVSCAVLLPDYKLEKESKKQVRKLLANNKLTTIIKLPPETFTEGVSVSIFLFDTGHKTSDDIFTCKISDDGLVTIKNKGRQDVKHRWPEVEDRFLYIVSHYDDSDEDSKFITPNIQDCENLSYQEKEKPFEICDEDFMKTVMDYEMFKQGINRKDVERKIVNDTMYGADMARLGDTLLVSVPDKPTPIFKEGDNIND